MRGTLADLHEHLRKIGFSYQYKAGMPSYSVSGKALYKDPLGNERLLKRIAIGKPAMLTGAKVGWVRTAQQPDLWGIFKRRRK